ncbi:glycosyltransferase [Parabacteroides sp. OttesenSCG-928-N08]|nr:glycosyltransferase [Parabacteroides sp. OttesenSCG-928-N08]
MSNQKKMPDYLFESSWEVCNKVGGIYTVLSTKAHTLDELLEDRLIFIGPDIWEESSPNDFIEETALFADWRQHAVENDQIHARVGRWNVPGTPPVILVKFNNYYGERDKLFFSMWQDFGVSSLNAYGDYDESCMFAYAVGKVIESFYHFYHLEKKQVAAHFNEWMLGMGALYIKKNIPAIATLFTTHATSIGRSIAGNNKALYAYMDGYNGDQMARELNMEAKHSLEKQAAHHVDCFTTVSDITAHECEKLLDKVPDMVTPNGFERNFVPEGAAYKKRRQQARAQLLNVAEKLLGCPISPDALLVSTSGRYEYRNKGIDVFIKAMNRVRTSGRLQSEMVAFVMVPAWVKAPRADLKEVVEKQLPVNAPMQMPFCTHWLHQMQEDKVLSYIQQVGFTNQANDKLKIIFVPCYLDGNDGIFNTPYYDLLIGMDATVYPSYYEPWGYTPLESIAFGIPTITTNLAGFGLWAKKTVSGANIEEGVVVINRTDFNYDEVADSIAKQLIALSNKEPNELDMIKRQCQKLANKAEWKRFIAYYELAYNLALQSAADRNS